MYAYITRELAEVDEELSDRPEAQGIFGHSMGGHGALTIGLQNPGRYRSISAFAPIAAPMQCPWGQKAFSGYLGADRDLGARTMPAKLIRTLPSVTGRPLLLVDQGLGTVPRAAADAGSAQQACRMPAIR
jgi:S-formylglutathione hydrolase